MFIQNISVRVFLVCFENYNGDLTIYNFRWKFSSISLTPNKPLQILSGLIEITGVLFTHYGNSNGMKHILSQHIPKSSGRDDFEVLSQWIFLIVCHQICNDDSQLTQQAFRRWWVGCIKFSSNSASSCKHRICLLTYAHKALIQYRYVVLAV